MAFDTKNPLFHLVPDSLTKGGMLNNADLLAYATQANENVDTVRGSLFVVLVAWGLAPNIATTILNEVLNLDPSFRRPMRERWTEYPESMTRVLWTIARKTALKWIDANMPEHWARDMFTDEPATPG